MTKSPRKNVPDELGAACMPSGHASDRATAPGKTVLWKGLQVKKGVSAIRRFDWTRENIRHTGFRRLDIKGIYLILIGSGITETFPYSFGNFRKLSLYNCFMPI